MVDNCDILSTFILQCSRHVAESWCRTVSLRKDKKRLETHGDFSFPSNSKYQDSRTGRPEDDQVTLEENAEEAAISENVLAENLVEASKSWALVISRCQLKNGWICIYLDKQHAFSSTLHTILTSGKLYGTSSSDNKEIAVLADGVTARMDLSEWRVMLTSNVIMRLLSCTGHRVLKDRRVHQTHIHVTSKPSTLCNRSCTRVICGGVREQISMQEYRSNKYKDIQEAAGLTTDEKLLEQLVDASVKMDLLYVKPSRAVNINKVSCSRGACFVLYNCARLATIMKKFEDKISTGYYPALIPLADVDFSKLNKEEEWELLLEYLLQYPAVVKHAAAQLGPNHICIFVQSLCGSFSVYYRRVRILTEPRSQMLPVMFARVYLLKAVQQVLHNALALVDILPVAYM